MFGRSAEKGPSRRWRDGLRFGATLVFFVATLFASGIEVTGIHHHDAAGTHPNCVICRVVSGPVDSVPQDMAPLGRDLPEAPGELAPVVRPASLAPHLVHIRLRAPPTAI